MYVADSGNSRVLKFSELGDQLWASNVDAVVYQGQVRRPTALFLWFCSDCACPLDSWGAPVDAGSVDAAAPQGQVKQQLCSTF